MYAMNELEEQLARYTRLLENDDFKKTIKELDQAFNLDGSVFQACNLQNAEYYLFGREAIRTYRNKLLGLKEETEQAIEEREENE